MHDAGVPTRGNTVYVNGGLRTCTSHMTEQLWKTAFISTIRLNTTALWPFEKDVSSS